MRHYRLAAGETRITRGAAMIETTLGSCVAAVFWHPPSRTGAMCHAALPECPHASGGQQLRYVDYSIRYLLTRLQAKGIPRDETEVKLFGGANVLPARAADKTVGSQNLKVAKRVLEEERLRLAASDLGGLFGRVIYFRVDTGEVFLRRLPNAPAQSEDRRDGSARASKRFRNQ